MIRHNPGEHNGIPRGLANMAEGPPYDAWGWQPYPAYIDATHNFMQLSQQVEASSYRQEAHLSDEGSHLLWVNYTENLAKVFRYIRDKELRIAGKSLEELSDWLLSRVQQFGLHNDDQSLHDHRLELWKKFNYAWLGLLQAQKDMSDSGVRQSSKLISQSALESMGKNLIKLCDAIEKDGLVDYSYGVWEEQIMEVLLACINNSDDDKGPRSGGERGQNSR